MALGKIASSFMGNLNEISTEQLQKNFGKYLMSDENISIGYELIRDTVIFTDKHIIDFDR